MDFEKEKIHGGFAMIAYYVHNDQENSAQIIIPDMHCSIPASTEAMEQFISPKPDFSALSKDSCKELKPEDFGVVLATRDTAGDVNVLKEQQWQSELARYLNPPTLDGA
jgi:hypothetical protein